MQYLLDTNICIYIIKQRPAGVFEKFKTLQPGSLAISAVTFAELLYGVMKSAHPQKTKPHWKSLLLRLKYWILTDLPVLNMAGFGHILKNRERPSAPWIH